MPKMAALESKHATAAHPCCNPCALVDYGTPSTLMPEKPMGSILGDRKTSGRSNGNC